MEMLNDGRVNKARGNVSVVIPCYKSAATIGDVVRGMSSVLSEHEYPHEFILVNDGSGPDTFNAICALCKEFNTVHGVDLVRNCGQHLAVLTGLRRAKGDIVVVMDDDMQSRPDQSVLLIEAVAKGADVAFADYEKTRESFPRRTASRLSAFSSCLLTNRPRDLRINSFYAVKGSIAREVAVYACPNVNVQAAILKVTHKAVNVKIVHQERASGESGYTLRKLLHVWISLLNFSNFPASFSACAALIMGVLGTALIVVGIIVHNEMTAIGGLVVVCTAPLLVCLAMIALQVHQALCAISGIPQAAVRKEVSSRDMETSNE